MTQPTHPDDLLALRAEIDQIDARLADLLGARFRATARVGRLKARQALDPVDPVREAQQAQRYDQLAAEHGLSPAFTQRLFRCIIDEVVAKHRETRQGERQTP